MRLVDQHTSNVDLLGQPHRLRLVLGVDPARVAEALIGQDLLGPIDRLVEAGVAVHRQHHRQLLAREWELGAGRLLLHNEELGVVGGRAQPGQLGDHPWRLGDYIAR